MRELWSRLEDVGVATLATHTHRRHHPHLSYVVLRSWDPGRVQEVLAAQRPAAPLPAAVSRSPAAPPCPPPAPGPPPPPPSPPTSRCASGASSPHWRRPAPRCTGTT